MGKIEEAFNAVVLGRLLKMDNVNLPLLLELRKLSQDKLIKSGQPYVHEDIEEKVIEALREFGTLFGKLAFIWSEQPDEVKEEWLKGLKEILSREEENPDG